MNKNNTIKTLKRNQKNYPLFLDKLIWVALLVLIQAWFIVITSISLREKYLELQTIMSVLSALVVWYIINQPINPSYKLAWSVTILFIPIFGGLFYILLSVNTYRRKFRNGIRSSVQRAKHHLKQDPSVLNHIETISRHAIPQAEYIQNLTKYPVYENTYVEYFSSGEAMYFSMLAELEKAKHFIFLEYFIIHEGVFWDSVLTILKKKAMQGVDIRIIYDDMGSISTLPEGYDAMLRDYGIKCYAFNPFRPILSLRLNNRDHRKILVIDGHTSFTGGINLADEYINHLEMNGYWKDTGIMLKGEATWNFTNMFLQLWQYLANEKVDYERFHTPVSKYPKHFPQNGNGFVQPYADNPLFSEVVAENVYLNMIHRATKYIYITTPYLIVDNEMITALTLAAQSGIDVRIITPGVPDKKAVFMMSRSFYEPLLKAGVKIYEYTPGFIHAKMMVVDDNYAVVGSINMDFRSLYLHFECAAFLYHCEVIEDIKEDIEDTIAVSQEITYEYCLNLNRPYRLWQSLLRLYAPLL
ncbi:MAG: cardiolipin synthase [Eubacteriales bacterium]|nr:cardiolipin synthase [Eubacteriales bacterium]